MKRTDLSKYYKALLDALLKCERILKLSSEWCNYFDSVKTLEIARSWSEKRFRIIEVKCIIVQELYNLSYHF